MSGNENVKEFRIPSMITTIAETVLTVCDARVDRRGDVPNNIDLVVKRSLDNGKTWSKPELMNYATGLPLRNPRACPRLWKCENGKYLLWYHNNGERGFKHRNAPI